MKTTLLFLSVFLSTSLLGQTTYVPDDNFEQALIEQGYDDIIDGQVLTSIISEITSLFIIQKGIFDLTGIEDFSSLVSLNCAHNDIDAIDVSQNQFLTELFCNSNQIVSLVLSTNTALTKLNCSSNQIGQLDLSENHLLVDLNCSNNALHCLNIKNGNNLNMDYFIVTSNLGLSCIELDEVPYSGNGMSVDSPISFSINCENACSSIATGINEQNSSKNLIRIFDLMGRETDFKPNTPLIYVFDDGSTERMFAIR